jgi:uncharacterized protein YjbJ (UPF0337 family)
MSTQTTKKKIEGAADRVSGKVKAGVGKATGKKSLEAEGRAQALVGKAKIEGAKAVGKLAHEAREVADKVEKAIEKKLEALGDAGARES